MTSIERFAGSRARSRVTVSSSARVWIAALAALALLILAPVLAHAQADTLQLIWTAPGDDDGIGTATTYDVRMSLNPINASNFSSATLISGAPSPLPSGQHQRMTVRNLTRGTTYYFAIKAIDDAGNIAALSNVVLWDWALDTAPPASPSGVASTVQPGKDVNLQWNANSEPDLAGYAVYRALDAGGPFVRITGPLVSSTTFFDNTVPDSASNAWYQLSALDDSGNESARTSPLHVSLGSSVAASAAKWQIQPGYPNPSSAGASVTLPVNVPGTSARDATIEIFNNAAQRVRLLELRGLAPGVTLVSWDGRNDSGREVAPGVYRAWLNAGDVRLAVRLVRLP